MAHKRNTGLVRLFFGKVPEDQIQQAYRVRIALFFCFGCYICHCAVPNLPTHSNLRSIIPRRASKGQLATAGRRDRVSETEGRQRGG